VKATAKNTSGIELIRSERERQILDEGYDKYHDDCHTREEIAWAAACYAAPEEIWRRDTASRDFLLKDPWPFDWYDKRPVDPTPEQRIRSLVKAGALCAAEIDRLLRRSR